MDLLQIALIFLILLLSIFLAITGIQVFFILRDLKKALDRLNKVLKTSEDLAEDIEKPVGVMSNAVTASINSGVLAISNLVKKPLKPKPKRFYKKVL